MNTRDILILVSFVLGLIPVLLLTVMYAWKANWKTTSTGRAVFALFVVFSIWAVLSVLTLTWPDALRGEIGEWARIVIRLITDLVLWNIFRVFMRAQHRIAGVPTPARGIPVQESDRT